MGVDLSDILLPRPLGDGEMNGKVVALDAFNVLYQFLSSIRLRDGTPLTDPHGRVTSHLQGLLSRNANLLRDGIRPVYVFDGEMLELKQDTVDGRRAVREKAQKEWKSALDRGDIETAARKARQSSKLTADMVEEAKELLDMLGIPWIQAPHDGEAQASYMCRKGTVWSVASQDYDCLLLGSPRLVRNLGFAGRRRLPRGGWVKVEAQMLVLDDELSRLGITREQLVDIAILVGTDFNPGVKGIGPKTALKLLKKHGSIENVPRDIDIDDLAAVRDIFLEPSVEEETELTFGRPDHSAVEELLCVQRGFSRERVRAHLKVIAEGLSAKQATLDPWF